MPGVERTGPPAPPLLTRRRRRILYLHQHYSRPDGSTGTRSFLHAGALTEAGHGVTLACGRYAGARSGLGGPFRLGARRGAPDGFDVVEFDIPCGNAQRLPARASAFLRFAARAAALALRGEWDLVVASSTPLTVAIPALLARRLRGVPFVFEIRDPWPEMPRALAPGRIPAPVLGALDRLANAACREAAATVALTEGMARTAIAHGADPARVHVLPQGADLDLFGPLAAPWRPDCAAPDELLAVYAGAHGPANGLDQLLDAAALLRGAGVRLLLVGEGARKAALVARAKAEHLPVCFLDPLPKPRIAQLLAGADVALLCLADVPALGELSAPNKLAEGLAAGLPIVANVPGRAARLLEDGRCGLAVPPGDAPALAAALRRLAQDPRARHAMGRAARELAEARLDARRIARDFVGLVEMVA